MNLVPSFPMGANGVYGEEIIVPGHAVVTQPPDLTFEEAASIWVMFLTAYGPLIEDAQIQPGEHEQGVLDAGAKHVVVLSEVDLTDEVLRITGGRGARVAFDPVGGELLPKLIWAVPKGLIYLYGALGGENTTIPVLEALMHRTTIKAWIIADLLADEDRKRKAINYVTDALRRKEISPVIDSVFTFEDMVAAHRHLESGRQFGKVVVKVGDAREG